MAKRKRIWRWVLLVAGLGVAAVVVLGVVTYLRVQAVPDYWQVVEVADQNVNREAGEFEQWVSSQLTKQRPSGEPWQIELTEADINKWLAIRLPSWTANQEVEIPDWLAHPMMSIEKDRIVGACQITREEGEFIFSAAYKPKYDEAAMALQLDGVYLGTQKVAGSGEQLMGRLERVMDFSAFDEKNIEAWREKIERIVMDAKLGDGRTVQVIRIDLSDGKMVLTCTTDPVADRPGEP